MVHQTKHRAWVARYALSAALIALGTTSLSAVPTAAKAQAVTSPPGCHFDGNDDTNACPAPAPAPAPPQAQRQPTPPDPKNQAQNRLQ